MTTLRQRVPLKEAGFVAGLLLAALAVGLLSGRTAILPELLRPALWVGAGVRGGVDGTAAYWHRQDALIKQNHALQDQVRTLRADLVHLDEQEAENARLKALAGIQTPGLGTPVTAQVIGRSPDNWHERLILDRGSTAGIQAWGVVMSPDGLVGRVATVAPHASVVQLLSDPAIAVSVLDERSRSAGILVGSTDGRMTLRYLLQQVDFRVGDELVTSGLGGRYPKGIAVGKVVTVVQQAHSITPDVDVIPAVDLDTLEDVRVYPPGRGLAALGL